MRFGILLQLSMRHEMDEDIKCQLLKKIKKNTEVYTSETAPLDGNVHNQSLMAPCPSKGCDK